MTALSRNLLNVSKSKAYRRGIIYQVPVALKQLLIYSADVACHEQRLMSSTSLSSSETGTDERNDVPDSKLFSFLKLVKIEKLNDSEKVIHQRHVEALQERHEVYLDPATGYDVLTRLAHLRRGTCCGNACRHCPFGQSSVKDERAKKKYNSAFFV